MANAKNGLNVVLETNDMKETKKDPVDEIKKGDFLLFTQTKTVKIVVYTKSQNSIEFVDLETGIQYAQNKASINDSLKNGEVKIIEDFNLVIKKVKNL